MTAIYAVSTNLLSIQYSYQTFQNCTTEKYYVLVDVHFFITSISLTVTNFGMHSTVHLQQVISL